MDGAGNDISGADIGRKKEKKGRERKYVSTYIAVLELPKLTDLRKAPHRAAAKLFSAAPRMPKATACVAGSPAAAWPTACASTVGGVSGMLRGCGEPPLRTLSPGKASVPSSASPTLPLSDGVSASSSPMCRAIAASHLSKTLGGVWPMGQASASAAPYLLRRTSFAKARSSRRS